jgi:hypothetical protein
MSVGDLLGCPRKISFTVARAPFACNPISRASLADTMTTAKVARPVLPVFPVPLTRLRAHGGNAARYEVPLPCLSVPYSVS